MRKGLWSLAVASIALALGGSHAAPFPIDYAIVGTRPVAAAYNPVSHTFIVANNASADVSILAGAGAGSGKTRAGGLVEIARVDTGAGPSGVAVHETTGLTFVSNQGANTISVLAGPVVAQTLTITGANPQPWGMDVDEQTNRLCVAMFGDNKVHVYDTTSRAPVGQIPVDSGPNGVAAAGGFCYVTSFYAGTVSKIDLRTMTVSAKGLAVPGVIQSCPTAAAMTPDGSLLYVANQCSGSVSKIFPGNLGVAATIGLFPGAAPTGVDASDATVYVGQTGRDSVGLIGVASNAYTEILGGGGAAGVAVGSAPECAVVANSKDETAGLYCDTR